MKSILSVTLLLFSSIVSASDFTLVCTYNRFGCCPHTYDVDLENKSIIDVEDNDKWKIRALSESRLIASNRESEMFINRVTGEITHGNLLGRCVRKSAAF
ncbi:hypothetical protein K7402_15390 [Pseudomonas fluorescens group sp.]|uniref:Uncharacterized protein n=1 Tax=Pseudomonas fluorescens TaxID=294 RepID=A0ACD4XMM2_PSEFL|nr:MULTISPECIES: hypothetical protein [Pseudomonas fluorescens group]MBZ6456687.1 hypothetical protein [Pseudomonas fluorescens group sp.]MBZ6462634.1 hypothetical protein [Pseudomonas fluorescens group sp.]MBZ6468775.1 hypothetical protein [Pseudomonas fluorescens group sp.]WQD70465.1 hypothetical protein U0037_20670 [Pseudomonas marginalis]